MGEENKKQKKELNYKIIAVGLTMISLTKLVEDKFEKEYGFKPNMVDITDLIARRVINNKLF